MTIHRSAIRWAAVGIVLVTAFASHPTVANHYILPCEQCDQATAFAYIGDSSSRNLTVVDTTANEVVHTVNVGQTVMAVAMAPDGKRVYAANADNVLVIDTTTHAAIATIEYQTYDPTYAGTSVGVALNPAGTRLYVTDQRRAGIAVIDTATNTVLHQVTTGFYAFNVVVSPDGTRVYATDTYNDIVSVIDATNDSLITNIAIDNPFFSPPIGAGDFSAGPFGLVVNPAGTRVYVATVFLVDPTYSNYYVAVIDTATNAIVAYVPTGPASSSRIAINPAGTRVYLSNGAVIETASNTVVDTVDGLSGFISGLAMHPSGSRIYVLQQELGRLLVVDTIKNAVVATVPLEGTPWMSGQFVGPMLRNSDGTIKVLPTDP